MAQWAFERAVQYRHGRPLTEPVQEQPSTFFNIIGKNIGIERARRLPSQRVLRDASLSWNGRRIWCATALKSCQTARNLLNTAILLDRQEEQS